VHAVVKQSGYSHRHFISLFRGAVGLSPKAHCRILRFQKALRCASDGTASWAWIALEAGYSDQAHFNRDFLEFTGVTPMVYRRIAPAFPYHIAVPTRPSARSNSFKTHGGSGTKLYSSRVRVGP
jgi:AraC-like DNA-binding protein